MSQTEITSLLTGQPATGFPTIASLMHLGKDLKHRTSIDLVDPKLALRNELAYIQCADGTTRTLFSMDSPLIDQILCLKHFITPENVEFFVSWIRNLHARCSDHEGRQVLFAGSHDADMWFQQKLPVIDMANPIRGALETIQIAKARML